MLICAWRLSHRQSRSGTIFCQGRVGDNPTVTKQMAPNRLCPAEGKPHVGSVRSDSHLSTLADLKNLGAEQESSKIIFLRRPFLESVGYNKSPSTKEDAPRGNLWLAFSLHDRRIGHMRFRFIRCPLSYILHIRCALGTNLIVQRCAGVLRDQAFQKIIRRLTGKVLCEPHSAHFQENE